MLPAVVTVRVEEPPAVTDVGLKEAEAPVGRPEVESATLWAVPEVTAVEMVEVADPPELTLAEAGLSEMEKSLTVVPPLSVTSS